MPLNCLTTRSKSPQSWCISLSFHSTIHHISGQPHFTQAAQRRSFPSHYSPCHLSSAGATPTSVVPAVGKQPYTEYKQAPQVIQSPSYFTVKNVQRRPSSTLGRNKGQKRTTTLSVLFCHRLWQLVMALSAFTAAY